MSHPNAEGGVGKRASRSLASVGFLQLFRRVISFVVTLLLYRLLNTHDFGIYALCEIVLSFFILFQDLGFQDALVQQKQSANFSNKLQSVWFLKIGLTAILLIFSFVGSDTIAQILGQDVLSLPIRILSIVLLINLFSFRQEIIAQSDVRFEKLFWPGVFSQLGSALIGVTGAFMGAGYWALIWACLGGQTARVAAVLFCRIPVPQLKKLDRPALTQILPASFALFAIAILSLLSNQTIQIAVSRLFNLESVGWFYLAMNWSNFIVVNALQFTSQVAIPAMTEVRDDLERIRKAFFKHLEWTSFIAALFNSLLMVLAGELIPCLVGEKWIPAAKICQILCVYAYFRALATPFLTLLQACGQNRAVLTAKIIEYSVFLILIIPSSRVGGLSAAAATLCFSKAIGWILTLNGSVKILNLKPWEVIQKLIPSVCASSVCGGFIGWLHIKIAHAAVPAAVSLPLLVVIGSIIYYITYGYLRPSFRKEAWETVLSLTGRK